MGALTLPLAIANVYANENRLPLANVRLNPCEFEAYQTPHGDTIFKSDLRSSHNSNIVYVGDGSNAVYACAIERHKSGHIWSEAKATANLTWLHVPGLDGTLKLRHFSGEDTIDIYSPLPGAETERHFVAEAHRITTAKRVTDWFPALTFLKSALVYGYEDTYDLVQIGQLGNGRFLFVSKALWSNSTAPYQVTYVDADKRSHAVNFEVIRKCGGSTALRTPFGNIVINDESLSDKDIAPVASLLHSAGVLAVSPQTLASKNAILSALGLDLGPRPLVKRSA